MLSRVLIEELSQRLPQSTVFGESGAVTASPDATIELNMQRLDEDAAGNLVLQAQASVSFKGRSAPVLRNFRFVVTAADARISRARSRQSARRSASSRTGLASMLVTGPVMRFAADQPMTEPQLRECPGCGLFQTVPPLAPGMTARCARCPTILRRTSAHRLDHIIALTSSAFVLLVVMCSTTLMSVETAGITRTANLFSGPEELVRRNMGELAVVVIFVTVAGAAPQARSACFMC